MTTPFYDFFTSAFVQESPAVLLKNYNQKLLKSLASLFTSVEKTLNVNLLELRNSISKVEAERKLTPMLYTYHAFLREGIKQGSVKSVTHFVRKIEQALKNEQIYAPPFSIQTISSEEWEQQILNDLNDQNRNKVGDLSSLTAVEEVAIEPVNRIITKSLEFLKQISPLFLNEFETYVANLKLFRSNRLVGMTDVRVFGTIYLCMSKGDMPETIYFCEHIIHETSHLHLHTLFAIDRLILNDPSERYTAPIRPDPRPMYGVFHATFVLSRMVRLFMLLAEKIDPSFEEYFELFLKRFLSGYNTIKNFGKLTPLGEKILESYSDIISLRTFAGV